MKLRDYQIDIAEKSVIQLRSKMIVYICSEVRTGKTLMALETAKLFNAKNVLFLTKKKAISSIEQDYNDFEYHNYFNITIINDESMSKAIGNFDLIIHDEHHRFSSFPKAGKGTKDFKLRFSRLPMIFLSGTPTPENYSQIYHQFWVSNFSPFGEINFYKWAKNYVNVKVKHLGFGVVNDYSDANINLIKQKINPYMIYFTQKEAGFESEVKENVMFVDMKESTYKLINRLEKDLVIEGKDEVVLADTGAKLMSKLHQLYSGTIKFESGNRMTIDNSKALFIQEKFKGKKLFIFYKFQEELNLIVSVFGPKITTDLDDFNKTDKHLCLQIVSGREGINGSAADCIIYFNIDFSATSYWQSRDRLTTKERLSNDVYWIFAKGGIEEKIYKTVQSKKNYTLSHFKQNYEKGKFN